VLDEAFDRIERFLKRHRSRSKTEMDS